VLLQDGGASAMKSEHESVGFPRSVRVYLFCSRSRICEIDHHIS
jgi:hypothetical protein